MCMSFFNFVKVYANLFFGPVFFALDSKIIPQINI